MSRKRPRHRIGKPRCAPRRKPGCTFMWRPRYLQEVVGGCRGQIKEVFDKINHSFPGVHLVDLEDLMKFSPLLLPNAKLLVGRDSLYLRRHGFTVAEVEEAIRTSA